MIFVFILPTDLKGGIDPNHALYHVKENIYYLLHQYNSSAHLDENFLLSSLTTVFYVVHTLFIFDKISLNKDQIC